MEEGISVKDTLDGISHLLNSFPANPYYQHAIPSVNLNGYGTGAEAFNKLRTDFQVIDFSEVIKSTELSKKIKQQEKDIKELEARHASLVAIFGEDGGASEGTLTHDLIMKLDGEITDLIQTRDNLRSEVFTVEKDSSEKILAAETAAAAKISIIEAGVITAQKNADAKVSEATAAASGKVRIINQFKDFIEETNTNMNLYYWVILILSFGASLTVIFSVPELLKCFDSYNTYLNKINGNTSSWQIINSALGILIVKLPWALCLSAVLTGMYRLLKNLLITFEKVNQDKRNVSAIYVVSGNIASSLNEYGLSIVEEEWNAEDEIYTTVLKTKWKDLNQKRENLKWNQIMNYFEGMQSKKEEAPEPEDPNRLKEITELLGKALDKLPSVK